MSYPPPNQYPPNNNYPPAYPQPGGYGYGAPPPRQGAGSAADFLPTSASGGYGGYGAAPGAVYNAPANMLDAFDGGSGAPPAGNYPPHGGVGGHYPPPAGGGSYHNAPTNVLNAFDSHGGYGQPAGSGGGYGQPPGSGGGYGQPPGSGGGYGQPAGSGGGYGHTGAHHPAANTAAQQAPGAGNYPPNAGQVQQQQPAASNSAAPAKTTSTPHPYGNSSSGGNPYGSSSSSANSNPYGSSSGGGNPYGGSSSGQPASPYGSSSSSSSNPYGSGAPANPYSSNSGGVPLSQSPYGSASQQPAASPYGASSTQTPPAVASTNAEAQRAQMLAQQAQQAEAEKQRLEREYAAKLKAMQDQLESQKQSAASAQREEAERVRMMAEERMRREYEQKLAAERAQKEAIHQQALQAEARAQQAQGQAMAAHQAAEAHRAQVEAEAKERFLAQQRASAVEQQAAEQLRQVQAAADRERAQALAAQKAEAEFRARQAAEAQAAAAAATAAAPVQQHHVPVQHQQPPVSTSSEIDPALVAMGPSLGKGAFGEVFRATMHGQLVAVKKLLNQSPSEEALNSFRQEMGVMSSLRHPNILLFMGACSTPGQLFIVMEFCEYGSLANLLHNEQAAVDLDFPRRMTMCKEIAAGMAWLHGQNLIHRDLKPENIIVGGDLRARVADFGLAAIKGDGFGSPFYMAPELLLDRPFGPPIDVFAYAITVWEVYTGSTPYPDFENLSDVVDGVALEGERPEFPPGSPEALVDLVERAWEAEPEERPTFAQILQLDPFTKLGQSAEVSDNQSMSFWQQHFPGRGAVDFGSLMGAYAQQFGVNPPPPGDIKASCLQMLLQEGDWVQQHTFNRVTSFFGWSPAAVDLIHATLSSGWFHGECTPVDAEAILRANKRKGSYLVRFTTAEEELPGPSCFIVSVLQEDGSVANTPIAIEGEAGFTMKGNRYASLDELLIKERKGLSLSVPCLGSRFDILFPDDDDDE